MQGLPKDLDKVSFKTNEPIKGRETDKRIANSTKRLVQQLLELTVEKEEQELLMVPISLYKMIEQIE
jgi:hypothetical protein